MNIEPTYVTFEQALLLKEKGFDLVVNSFYDYKGNEEDSEFIISVRSKKYNSECDHIGLISAPEQWQAIEWLRLNYCIFISTRHGGLNMKGEFGYFICEIIEATKDPQLYKTHKINWQMKKDYSPQEANSVAIDYVLKNII